MGTIALLSTARFAGRLSHECPNDVLSKNTIDCVHSRLRNMTIELRFLPGERLNETILAKELGVSRTPVREALNRLINEGFVTYLVNHGFFRKSLNVQEIFDLFEFRLQMELAAVRLAVERATDEQLLELERFSQQTTKDGSRASVEITLLDEEFHEQLISLSGNTEMLNRFRTVNDHIRFVRGMDVDDRRSEILIQHREIVRSLRERNAEKGMRLMTEHIELRHDQIMEKVERCYGRIYMNATATERSVHAGVRREIMNA